MTCLIIGLSEFCWSTDLISPKMFLSDDRRVAGPDNGNYNSVLSDLVIRPGSFFVCATETPSYSLCLSLRIGVHYRAFFRILREKEPDSLTLRIGILRGAYPLKTQLTNLVPGGGGGHEFVGVSEYGHPTGMKLVEGGSRSMVSSDVVVIEITPTGPDRADVHLVVLSNAQFSSETTDLSCGSHYGGSIDIAPHDPHPFRYVAYLSGNGLTATILHPPRHCHW
jgi:hypothetical protein